MTLNQETELTHQTVLLDEAVEALAIHDHRADGVYVDATFGRGGHSRKILSSLSSKGHLFSFDKDHMAIANARTITIRVFKLFTKVFLKWVTSWKHVASIKSMAF